ncbi:hypothetical protein GGX14DRAFT_652576 [Mycena pura]|uniref:Uncharacterized protein n=1 Tax=Mycena pura TaxID=153505 RepID=A0AAD6VCF4_9AGAR|nr:hypothetical protein GGX14DRAFT_652576 [Mycena pura]
MTMHERLHFGVDEHRCCAQGNVCRQREYRGSERGSATGSQAVRGENYGGRWGRLSSAGRKIYTVQKSADWGDVSWRFALALRPSQFSDTATPVVPPVDLRAMGSSSRPLRVTLKIETGAAVVPQRLITFNVACIGLHCPSRSVDCSEKSPSNRSVMASCGAADDRQYLVWGVLSLATSFRAERMAPRRPDVDAPNAVSKSTHLRSWCQPSAPWGRTCCVHANVQLVRRVEIAHVLLEAGRRSGWNRGYGTSCNVRERSCGAAVAGAFDMSMLRQRRRAACAWWSVLRMDGRSQASRDATVHCGIFPLATFVVWATLRKIDSWGIGISTTCKLPGVDGYISDFAFQ